MCSWTVIVMVLYVDHAAFNGTWVNRKKTRTHTIKQTIIQIREEKKPTTTLVLWMRNRDTKWWEQTGNGNGKTGKIYTKWKKNNINTHTQCREDKWCTGSWHSWWPQFYRRMNTSVFGLIASMRFILYDAHKTTTFNIYRCV